MRGENGRLRVDEEGLLPADLEQHLDLGGVDANFWIGLGVLHTLFTLEHNAICERLERENPHWSDDRLYATARLVNGALMVAVATPRCDQSTAFWTAIVSGAIVAPKPRPQVPSTRANTTSLVRMSC